MGHEFEYDHFFGILRGVKFRKEEVSATGFFDAKEVPKLIRATERLWIPLHSLGTVHLYILAAFLSCLHSLNM